MQLPEFLKLFYRPGATQNATAHRDDIDKSAKRVAQTMLVSLLIGMALTWLGARSEPAPALLWALACSGVGWFLGFLFGIPRSLAQAQPVQPQPVQPQPVQPQPVQAQPVQDQPIQLQPIQPQPVQPQLIQDQPVQQAQPVQDQPVRAQPAQPQPVVHVSTTEVNTNLEQISDWLTKIIVGVTLVEINPVLARLGQAASLIAKSLGGEEHSSFGYAILVYFSTSGFLGSYLLTRLYLQLAFGRVGQAPKP